MTTYERVSMVGIYGFGLSALILLPAGHLAGSDVMLRTGMAFAAINFVVTVVNCAIEVIGAIRHRRALPRPRYSYDARGTVITEDT
jgi:hypothetical protein